MTERQIQDQPDYEDTLSGEFWAFEERLTDERFEGMKSLLEAAYFLATLQEPETVYYSNAENKIEKIDVFPYLCSVLLFLADHIRTPLQKELDLGRKVEIAQAWEEYHRKMSRLFRPK